MPLRENSEGFDAKKFLNAVSTSLLEELPSRLEL